MIIKVQHARSESDQHPREVATISYSWNPGADEVWRITNEGFPNPFLDPFHKQASYADELMEFWSDMVENDHVYAQRLKSHYRELREKRGTSERQATSFDPSAFDVPMNREERRRLWCRRWCPSLVPATSMIVSSGSLPNWRARAGSADYRPVSGS